MNQCISSLNLTKQKIMQLKSHGINYCCDLQENELLNLPVGSPITKTALDVYHEELLHSCVLSYNENLDNILRDELVPKSVTELTGEPGSGKTQICLQLSISVQLPKCVGGLNGEAIYICTNKNFSSDRLRELAEKFVNRYKNLKTKANIFNDTDFDVDYILEHVYYMSISDIVELIACIKHLETFLQNKNVKLIIIDSISYPLRIVLPSERPTMIFNIFRNLHILSQHHHFSTVITNDLTTRVNNSVPYNTPSFGDSFYHFINTRILLSKKYANVFNAKLIKTISQSPKETIFSM